MWRGQKTWNGVAILARTEPIVTRTSLPGAQDDEQARYLEAAVNGVLVASLYLPNGNPQPGPKFDYKLAWFERLIGHAQDLMTLDVPVVLAGDFNVVPTDFDIYPSRSWDKDALLQPESRAAFCRLVDQGWTDALRALHPDEPMYTFWDYKRDRWNRNAGLRIDHLLVTPDLAPGSPKRASIGGCAPKKEQAITRQLGSSSGKGIERAREPSCRSRHSQRDPNENAPEWSGAFLLSCAIRQRRNRLR